MTLWLVQAINGLSYGMLLFILGAGLTLGFGLLRIINLAHGSYYLLGGYIGIKVFAATGSFWLALLVSGSAIALLGFAMWKLLLNRYLSNELAMVLLTFGFMLLIADLSFWQFGGAPQTVADALWFDYQAGGRSDKPPFLRAYLPDVTVSRRDRSRAAAPKRQERHLATKLGNLPG